jgi:5'-3' exonuclease
MKQVIKKRIKTANNISDENLIMTLLVDGNSLLKSSLVNKEMNSKGEEYGAVWNMLRRIGELLLKKDFNYCIVAYDGNGSGVLRYKYYPLYKANRDKHYSFHSSETEYDRKIEEFCKRTLAYYRSGKKEIKRSETDDENFQRQRELIQEILDNLFVRQVMYDDVEGDDIIAYYCQNKKSNERVVIVSEDRDLTQLITDEICIWIPSIHKFITPKNDVQELGYTHENVVLKKQICGDASDNIYGIKGVGEKGLLKLFPDLKSKKATLNEILTRSQEMQTDRLQHKKKPLKSLENMLNRVTDGCQGKDIYEINEKIIDLSKPMLTEEAENGLKNELYAPIDPEGRDIKNIYQIINDNGMVKLQDEKTFGNVFGAFERIIKMEKNYYEKNRTKEISKMG